MSVSLSAIQQDPSGAGEYLRYDAPQGSTLIGGTVSLSARADGGSGFGNAEVGLYEPGLVDDQSDRFFACVQGYTRCAGGQDYSGPVTLPADRGGQLYFWAQCGSLGGPGCDRGGSDGMWAAGRDHPGPAAAVQRLRAAGVGLRRQRARSAGRGGPRTWSSPRSDTGGPGIYAVSVALDGRLVWFGTPSVNGGRCVSRGSDPGTGALMFDNQQPCPVTEVVDVPVPTSGRPDGSHRLTVEVADAAGNVSTVRRPAHHHLKPPAHPGGAPRCAHAVRDQLEVVAPPHDIALGERASAAARRAHRGAVRRAWLPQDDSDQRGARHIGRLLRALRGRRFTAGDTLTITVSAPRRRPEQVKLMFRDNRQPTARLVR